MNTSQKILLIALSISFHSAIMSMKKDEFNYADAIICMQNAKAQKKIMHKLLKEQTSHIVKFAREPNHDPEHMKLLGVWLTEQRNNVSETNVWNTLIKNLTSDISDYRCLCLENDMTSAVVDVVTSIAQNLQPGQDCSQLLIDCAQKRIDIVKLKSKNKSIHNF